MDKYIKLFANCIIVKGISRSVVCDLQRNTFKLIPNSLATLFKNENFLHLEKAYKNLNDSDIEIFNDYLEFLIKYEFIFFCSKKELKKFPLLKLEWDYPAQISNAIIDIDVNSNHDYKNIIQNNLVFLNCRYIQFRRFDVSDLKYWENIIDIINDSPVRAVDIILHDSPNSFSNIDLCNWVKINRKIRSVTIHSSKKNSILQNQEVGFGVVVAIKQNIDSSKHCGIINSSYFTSNIETFTESQNFNSCLNRKISIDKDGSIKNCPSMKQSFGNIKNKLLKEVLQIPEFKKYWNISKDQIEVCKDCEFRYICTDCRAYLDDVDNIYSKPLKCGYNPYQNEWSEWSQNPLKKQAIDFYDF